MELSFVKMNGAGNDFVLLDNRLGEWSLTSELAVRICHRQRGVGADGLISLVPCASGKADWAWEFFNNDGSRAEMCGNGARCFARFVQRLTGVCGPITFETEAGVITAEFPGEQVTVNLTAPRDLRVDQVVNLSAGPQTIHSVNTGVPHAVLFVEDLDKTPVQSWGAEVRFHPQFAPRGTNVNFVQVIRPKWIRVRTYERGVESETLACGTGVTASAMLAALHGAFTPPVQVQVQGGDVLTVDFKETPTGISGVKLTGPADFVFKGKMMLANGDLCRHTQ